MGSLTSPKEIRMTSTAGNVEITSVSEDVVFDANTFMELSAGENVDITSDTGDITITSVTGRLDATAAGNLAITSTNARTIITGTTGVEIQSGTGSVDITGTTGVLIEADAGDLTIDVGLGFNMNVVADKDIQVIAGQDIDIHADGLSSTLTMTASDSIDISTVGTPGDITTTSQGTTTFISNSADVVVQYPASKSFIVQDTAGTPSTRLSVSGSGTQAQVRVDAVVTHIVDTLVDVGVGLFRINLYSNVHHLVLDGTATIHQITFPSSPTNWYDPDNIIATGIGAIHTFVVEQPNAGVSPVDFDSTDFRCATTPCPGVATATVIPGDKFRTYRFVCVTETCTPMMLVGSTETF